MTAPGPLALTCGEPAGIGPELAPLAWAALKDESVFFWIGDPRHLPAGSKFEPITAPGEAAAVMKRALPVLPHPFPGAPPRPGQPEAGHARAVIDVIERAVSLAMDGAVAGICTAPVSKAALKTGAGFAHTGHTEFLAALAGVDEVVMMLACDELKVVPVTIHIPLQEVPGALTADLLERTIRLTHAALIGVFGTESPRIAVAGLNPHAGEGGLMGRHEIDLIGPVLDRLRAEGMAIAGPLAADTMFHARARAGYDAAIAMYHDQALIPIKTIAFDEGVNVTLGLPFIRTSPDHGTAFDIAGQGVARPSSTVAALRLAARMAAARR